MSNSSHTVDSSHTSDSSHNDNTLTRPDKIRQDLICKRKSYSKSMHLSSSTGLDRNPETFALQLVYGVLFRGFPGPHQMLRLLASTTSSVSGFKNADHNVASY